MAIFKRQTKKDEVATKAAAKTPVKKAASKKAAPKKAAKKAVAKDSSKKSTAKKTTEKATKKQVQSRDAYKILMRPLITEKSSDKANDGVYYFEVAPGSDKIEVRDAVKALYGVVPRRVNIMNVKGKKVRFGRKEGRRKNWRKAMVFLKKGDHIQIYEGV